VLCGQREEAHVWVLEAERDTDESDDIPCIPSNYVAAFVDILGQRKHLASFRLLPDISKPEQEKEFMPVLKKTLGVVRDLHDSLRDVFSNYSRPAMVPNAPPEWSQTHDNLVKTDIRFQNFSDNSLVFLSLANNDVRCPINGVFGLLMACGMMCLKNLAGRHPIRGGIDLGWGIELDQNELYGSVVSTAYELESQIAQYQRIAVGDGLVSYLQSMSALDVKNVYDTFNQTLARKCLNLLNPDSDGVVFVDYLGEAFKNDVSGAIDATMVKAGIRFILDQLDQFKSQNDTKHVMRYLMLLDYLNRSASIWP